MTPIDCCIDEKIMFILKGYINKHQGILGNINNEEDVYNKRIV